MMEHGTAVYVAGVSGVDDETVFYYLGDDPHQIGNCLIADHCDGSSPSFTVPKGSVHPILQP